MPGCAFVLSAPAFDVRKFGVVRIEQSTHLVLRHARNRAHPAASHLAEVTPGSRRDALHFRSHSFVVRAPRTLHGAGDASAFLAHETAGCHIASRCSSCATARGSGS